MREPEAGQNLNAHGGESDSLVALLELLNQPRIAVAQRLRKKAQGQYQMSAGPERRGQNMDGKDEWIHDSPNHRIEF